MSDRARYWQRLVDAWEKSGLSQAEFCRRRGISAISFGWWKRKLRGTRKQSSDRVNRRVDRTRTSRNADFVELGLPVSVSAANAVGSTGSTAPRIRMASPLGPYGYEITLRSGRVIRLWQDFDPAVVSQLIAVGESC